MKKSFLIKTIAVAMVFLAVQSAFAQEKEPQFGKDPIRDIIKKMTLEEKVKVVVGKGFSVPGLSMGAVDKTPDKQVAISGHTIPNPKFGIPSIGMADGPAGIHRFAMSKQDSADNLYSTAWPVGTLLASSWDTALVKKVGVAFGEEIKSYGIDFILGPGVNIHRNPLGGRNFEYYSEDPLVSGRTAAALINGMQSQGVGTSIKHFVANNQETNRGSVNTVVSQRALRELYLKGFEIAIKGSHPWTVMSSYNKVNGPYTSENRDLLTTILKGEWGYKGLVMTDWFGGRDPIAQMNAGNDLLMPGTPVQTKAIVEGVNSGKIKMSQLDANVQRVLELVMRSPEFKKYKYSNTPNLKK